MFQTSENSLSFRTEPGIKPDTTPKKMNSRFKTDIYPDKIRRR